MTELADEEIQQYMDLRVKPLEKIERLSGNTLEKLKALEEKVIDGNSGCYGLPFYLAHEHHPGGKSVLNLSQELGVNQTSLRTLFSNFDIPTLTRQEASIRLHSDPAFAKKRAEGLRRNSEERRANTGRYRDISTEVDGDEITRLPTLVPNNMNYVPMKRKVREVGYRDVVKAYDEIITHTDHVGDWRDLIYPVSEKTGAESEFVKDCLERLFEIKS